MNNQPDMEKAASRKESLMREKTQTKPKKFKTNQSEQSNIGKKTTILAVTASILFLSLTIWVIFTNFISAPTQAVTIPGPQTLTEELIEDDSIVESEVMDRPGSGPFGLPENPEDPYLPEGNQYSVEDYSNNNIYTPVGGAIQSAPPSASETAAYRASGSGLSPSELLTQVGNALTVPGSIQLEGEFQSWGVLDGANLDETKPNVTYRVLDRNGTTSNRPLSLWFYSEGYVECNLNTEYDITGYSQEQLADITQEDRDCYYSSSVFGMSAPFPADEGIVSAKAETYMERLGYNTSDFKKTVSDLEGLTVVNYSYLIDGLPTTLEFEFVYSDYDKLRSASGMSFEIQKIGEYPMETPSNALNRLNNILYYSNQPTEYDSSYPNGFANRPYEPNVGPITEAYITHLLITYEPSINPETSPTPPGISTRFLPIGNPAWVKQVDETSNTWLISLGQDVNEDLSIILTQQIDNSSEIIFASVDYETLKTEKYNRNDSLTVNVDDFVEIWGEVEDFEGNLNILRSYMFLDTSQDMIVGSVIAYKDEAIGIR